MTDQTGLPNPHDPLDQQLVPQDTSQTPPPPASPYTPQKPVSQFLGDEQTQPYNPPQQTMPQNPLYQASYEQGTQPGYGVSQEVPVGTPQQPYTQTAPPFGYQQTPQDHQARQTGATAYQQGYSADPYGYQQGQQQANYYAPYPQNPYAGQQTYQEPPKKAKIWPWILAICLILAVLGIGGCASCAAYLSSYNDTPRYYDYYYDDGYYDRPYDDSYNDGYGYGYDNDYGYDENYGLSSTYTLADIKSLATDLKSEISEGVCTTGVFEVGKEKDLDAGLYYLEGSQETEGRFAVFTKNTSGTEYVMTQSVVYYGNYFAELNEGDIMLFLTPEEAHMYAAAEKAMTETGDTIPSGCYRVGTDIPAGTYTVTYQNDAIGEPASQEAGVYIMKDLAWNDDSIIESYGLVVGSKHTITVTEGQYVELYRGNMVAAVS